MDFGVFQVHGVAVQEEPVLIILELAPGGSLQHHLRKPIDLSAEKLIGYARDAARGMCYLSGRHVIHRDIAARLVASHVPMPTLIRTVAGTVCLERTMK